MSGTFLRPLFRDCSECKRVRFAELVFIKRHLRQKHDYQELLKKADSIGLIDDLTKIHSINYIIEKLSTFAGKREEIDCIVGIVNRLDENFKKLPHYDRGD